MSEKNPFRVFVCHAFQDNEDYQRVFEYLESRDNFFYMNYSNLESMPTSGGAEAIKEELRSQMKDAEVVVLPLAISVVNPDLIGFQLDYAEATKKPILGIQSFGGTVAVDQNLLGRCSDIIEWNERTLISAIKKLARDEDTAMWETVEFNLD